MSVVRCRCVVDPACPIHRVDVARTERDLRDLLLASKRASDRMLRALLAVLIATGLLLGLVALLLAG